MNGVPEVTVAEAAEPSDDVVLVDVREDDEWNAGHAPDAVHIRLGTLTTADLPDGRLHMICRSGQRSADAAMWLEPRGRRALNVAGGMRAWEAAGLPVVTDDGGPGIVI